jgi:DNA-binding transcriptional regulator LsrR (DeoR family)
VAGGERKHQAVRAAVAGGWVDTLVTDAGTAAFLLGEPAGAPADAAQAAARTAP